VRDLYYLSFRDISRPSSTGVTSAAIYRLRDVDANFAWDSAALDGSQWVPWADVPALFAGKRVCFVLHGFNVPLKSGVQSCGPAAQCYENLGALPLAMDGADIVVPVLWPGDGFIVWSYFTATIHAKTVGARFAAFLASAAFTGVEVSFISHSLGARVVLETVCSALDPASPQPRASFQTAILMAPAVDDNALDTPFATATGPGGLKRVVVLSSPTDHVLTKWFVLGDFAEQAMWEGYQGDSRALGALGPKFTTSSSAMPLTEWYQVGGGQDHGDYLPNGGASAPDPVWSAKQTSVGQACSDVVNRADFLPGLQGWGVDRTREFRPGWAPLRL
jgi:hypothetical protein